MGIHELAELTWQEVRDLERSRAVAILPIGAVEAHGPHLPLSTDAHIAEAMARAGASRVAADGTAVVLLPTLPYTAASFGAGFAGTISIDPATVSALVVGIARELTRQGFALLALANAHLDPAHLRALSDAVTRARQERSLPIVWPDLTRKPWAPRLGDEFRSGACHAGRFESSVVLAVRPDLVRDDLRRGLAPNPNSLSHAIRDGVQTFEAAGGPDAYFGWPADATAEEGRKTVETLGEILADAVLGALHGEV